LAKKRNSTRQRARQRLNGGRRTCDGASWARSQSEREGEGARLCVQLSGEGRVSVGGLHKRLGHVGRGRKMHGRGRIHGGGHGRFGGTVLTDGTHRSARPSERTGGWADEQGPRGRERGTHARGELAPTARFHWIARGREESARASADRRGPPVRGRRAHVRGLDGPSWAVLAEMWVSIFLEFLMAFLFYIL
jgi:hypothetical protein